MAKARRERSTYDMPLGEAYAHIKQVEGAWTLAAERLTQRVRSGDVRAQDHFVARPGEGVEIRPLTKEDFKDRVPNADADSIWFSGFWRLHGHHIFLCRADVYRFWPPIAAEKPQRGVQGQSAPECGSPCRRSTH
jgi:hypothetical protein